MQKTYIFVLTHGMWGTELIKSTEMVIGGTIQNIKAFPLMPETSLEDYENTLKNTMSELSGYNFLFLVDILGGTPYNIAAFYTQMYGIEAISGLSMDMLIATLDFRKEYPCSEIPTHIISKFKNSENYIMDLKKLLE